MAMGMNEWAIVAGFGLVAVCAVLEGYRIGCMVRDRRMNACDVRALAAWATWAEGVVAARGQGGGGGGSIGEPGPIAAVGEKVHTRKDTLQKIPKNIPG